MANSSQPEFLELMKAVAKVRQYLAADPIGEALVTDALSKLCRYYKSDPIAREGRYVIQNILSQHRHLHHSEKRVADWGFEVAVTCDNCGGEEKSEVVNPIVDIAAALMLGKHETCKPRPVVHVLGSQAIN